MFIANDHTLKLCFTGGRGSTQEIYLFRDGDNFSNFALIQTRVMMFMTKQVSQKSIFWNCLMCLNI